MIGGVIVRVIPPCHIVAIGDRREPRRVLGVDASWQTVNKRVEVWAEEERYSISVLVDRRQSSVRGREITAIGPAV